MMRVQEAVQALQADWVGGDVCFFGVSTDSRTLIPGDLFIALSGKNFNGHKFVHCAAEKGAVAAMVEKSCSIDSLMARLPLIRVADARIGLGQLAAYWRQRFPLPLIGVTGSNGKTTVKEMIASILHCAIGQSQIVKANDDLFVLATEGNLNNDIGVPQMLLRLRNQHRYAVIEMGMNHSGEIAYLTQMVKPNVAVITNAGAAHIEGLGSVEAVARAKGEIFEGLDQQGIAVINADDEYAPLWRRLADGKRVVEFGINRRAQVSADYQTIPLASKITLRLPDGIAQVTLQVPGKHNVRNALAAAAVAVAMGIKKEMIVSGLARFSGVQGRMQKKNGRHQAVLIDDSYNANPDSIRAALAVLAEVPGKRILILGDMGELGQRAADLHRSIGREARQAGINRLLALGSFSTYAVAAFGDGAQHFGNKEELIREAEKFLKHDVTVLIKGSRFMQMERIVQRLEC